jgi:hypothetical protein
MISKANKTVSFELTDAQAKSILKQVAEFQKHKTKLLRH